MIHRLFVLMLVSVACAWAESEVVLLSPFQVTKAGESELPPITVRKTGDYLLLQLELTNDTRDPDKRRDEIYETIKGMLAQGGQVAKLEISTREMVLNAANYQTRLELSPEKSDTSKVELLLKLPLTGADDVSALTAQLRSFAKKIHVIGRTEVFPGEIGISVRTPERFRYEVIAKVAEDVKRLKELFGNGFEIIVRGLDQRLRWQRASISELELYLPYSYEVYPKDAEKMVVSEN